MAEHAFKNFSLKVSEKRLEFDCWLSVQALFVVNIFFQIPVRLMEASHIVDILKKEIVHLTGKYNYNFQESFTIICTTNVFTP